MKAQNRVLILIVLLGLIVLFMFLLKSGHIPGLSGGTGLSGLGLGGSETNTAGDPNFTGSQEQAVSQLDAMGEPITEAIEASDTGDASQRIFATVLRDMLKCLDLQAKYSAATATISVETILTLVQPELGPSTVVDRWMGWHIRNSEGKERRLRLEITESDEGRLGRELHYYSVDRDGQPVPIELAPEKSMNPTDEVIKSMLKEGEVFYKERAAAALFPTGERLEYIDKNGSLDELEFLRSDRIYRCASVREKESCLCVK